MSSITPNPNDPASIAQMILGFLVAVCIAVIIWAIFKDSLNW